MQTLIDDRVLLELRLVRTELAELRASIDNMERRTLAREDRRTGLALLPLVWELMGTAAFTAPILSATALDDRSTTGQAVRELIGDYLSTDGELKAFGRLLARLDGIVLGGHRLVPVGQRRDGLAWRVVRLSSANNPQA